MARITVFQKLDITSTVSPTVSPISIPYPKARQSRSLGYQE
ncbi:MAG: hypothetical protein ACI8T1_004761, partial [Verrucomicrobiales bacterium]